MTRERSTSRAAMLLAMALLCEAAAAPALAAPPRWFDQAHGHARHYPPAGVRLRVLPPRAPALVWAGAPYWFSAGVWYAPAAVGGYVVVRPPFGIVVDDLPAFRTAVVIGGIGYLYLNGVYYRERAQGGYEVVPTPLVGPGGADGASGRLYVYPNRSQSAEQQADDEYACHRWAAAQSGFDPAPAATGQGADGARRGDYVRAQTACLEARGYTVR